MKKIIIMFIVLSVISLVGCSEKRLETDNSVNNESSTSGSLKTETNNQEEVAEKIVEENVNLKGEELLNSIKAKVPEKIYIEGTSYAEGITTQTKTIAYKDHLRYETTGTNGDQVMIYNADEGITYMYSVTSKTGTKYIDGEDEFDEDEFEIDIPIGNDFLSEIDGLITAEITNINNMEVLYIETQNPTGYGISTNKQWISTKFWHPVKSEMYFENELKAKYEATNITDEFKVEDSLFTPPADINFLDFDNMLDNIGNLNSGE